MEYTLSEFLAHAMALEREAEERYLELADMMEAHHNIDTAKIFRDMSRYSKKHGDAIAERTKHIEVRKLRLSEYRWRLPPEVGDDDGVTYLMAPYNALKYARDNEIRGLDYYRTVAQESQDPEVRRLGNEFADEEQEHVNALDHWIATVPRPSSTWMEDPDPPQAV